MAVIQALGPFDLRHWMVMLPPIFGNLKRGRQVEDLFAVLQRNHPPGGKTAAITSAIHAINHRNARITRTDKIRVQRMAQAGFYRVVSRSQRLRHHMAPKNPHAGLSARSGATEQIKLQPLEIHQCHKILNSIGHSIPAPLTGAPTSKLSCSKPPRSILPSTNAPCTNALSSARE